MVNEEVQGKKAKDYAINSWIDEHGNVHPPTSGVPRNATHFVASGLNGHDKVYWIRRSSFVKRKNRTQKRNNLSDSPSKKGMHYHKERCPMRKAALEANGEIDLHPGYEMYCGCRSCQKQTQQRPWKHNSVLLDTLEELPEDKNDVFEAIHRAAVVARAHLVNQ